MKEKIIYDTDFKGFTKAISHEFEYVNPVEYYVDCELKKWASINAHLLTSKNPVIASKLSNEFYYRRAAEMCIESFREIMVTQIPPNLIKLLNSKSKDEQKKLLKGQSLTSEQLLFFIFKAWTDYRFTSSRYISNHYPKNLNTNDLPQLFSFENGITKIVGKTNLTDGQLKQVLEHRKVIVSNFLDKGNTWHCFYATYKSLRGEEKQWKGGQVHLHYFSDKFGVSRDEFLKRLKSGNYPSSPVHIDLLDY